VRPINYSLQTGQIVTSEVKATWAATVKLGERQAPKSKESKATIPQVLAKCL
jgi:hypothetical protein